MTRLTSRLAVAALAVCPISAGAQQVTAIRAQMYQALRSLGRETELVIYPGEYHEISKPSYQRDRLQRYLDWYGRYLKQGVQAATP